MSVISLKLDDVPVVHAAYIFPSDNDGGDPIILGDQQCPSLSKALKEAQGTSLSALAKEYKKKPFRSKKQFSVHGDTYELYVLYASMDDKAVFVVEGDTLFTNALDLKQNENALLLLPFLDGALIRFLDRAEVYGVDAMPKKPVRSKHKPQRSTRMLQFKETFSLEEIFREWDVDGNGYLDLDEWKHGLTELMGDAAVSEDDMELVFNAICSDSGKVQWRQFYAYFDGKKLTARRTRSTQLQLGGNFASAVLANGGGGGGGSGGLTPLSTLAEGTDDGVAAMDADEMKSASADSEHIQRIKLRIRDCLNLGLDHQVSGSGTPGANSGGDSPAFSGGKDFGGGGGFDAENVDISKSLQRVESCEDLLDLMEGALYQVADWATMTRWENRMQSHKLRINQFRKILNSLLSRRMISMKDENTILLKQLENFRDTNHADAMHGLASLAELHQDQLNKSGGSLHALHRGGSKSNKLSRMTSTRSKRTSSMSVLSDDDTSSVDSEVSLVYTKGMHLSSREIESLMEKVKLHKKEVKKLNLQLKKMKETHKLETVKLTSTCDQLRQKLKSYEKARQSMVGKQQNIQEQMRKLQATQSRRTALQSTKDVSASNQREVSLLKKQLKNLNNELEAEQERNRNLQKKLTRVVSASQTEDDGKTTTSQVSANKLKRLEKEREKLEQECAAKSKKMDDMFLKLGKHQRDITLMEERNAELEAKL